MGDSLPLFFIEGGAGKGGAGCGGGEGAQHILWVSFVYHYSSFPVARHATWGMRLLVDMRVHMLVWGCCSRVSFPCVVPDSWAMCGAVCGVVKYLDRFCDGFSQGKSLCGPLWRLVWRQECLGFRPGCLLAGLRPVHCAALFVISQRRAELTSTWDLVFDPVLSRLL